MKLPVPMLPVPMLRGRAPLVTAVVAAALIVVSTTAGVSAAANETAAREQAGRQAAIAAAAHQVGVGAAGLDVAASVRASLAALVDRELDNAASVQTAATGKAAEATMHRLQRAVDRLLVAQAVGAGILEAVYTVRDAEKAAGEEVTAWQAAEDARIAAEEAAAAAAEQARLIAAAAADSSPPGASSRPRNPVPAPATPAPDAGCGPCPGATLVPVLVNGTSYWGCP